MGKSGKPAKAEAKKKAAIRQKAAEMKSMSSETQSELRELKQMVQKAMNNPTTPAPKQRQDKSKQWKSKHDDRQFSAPARQQGRHGPQIRDATSFQTPIITEPYNPLEEKSMTLMQQLSLTSNANGSAPAAFNTLTSLADVDIKSFVASKTYTSKQRLLVNERPDQPGSEGFGFLGIQGGDEIWLASGQPFTAVLTGVQGSGKSYSSLVFLENILLNAPPISHGRSSGRPTLVLHFDRAKSTYCEAISLALETQFGAEVEIPRVTVLVSPDNFLERSQHHYKSIPNVNVEPLLFSFDDIDARDLNTLMGLEDGAHKPLYAGAVMTVLRRFQRTGQHPKWQDFLGLIEHIDLNFSQSQMLQQRIDMVSSIMRESTSNEQYSDYRTLDAVFDESDVIIVDLTDSLIDPSFAGTLFSIMMQHFISIPGPGKTIFLDEAHKYLTSAPLCEVMTTTIRQQRHLGTRMLVSTQSPETVPAEVLELANIVILHAFHSPAWARYICEHVNLNMTPQQLLNALELLPPGNGVFFESTGRMCGEIMQFRRRLTRDCGSSKVST
ncbi:AAA-like domain [Carpediemonas membranifera]|uniref:AAA-like domain n=1 Tax=Carpediemonas membranifera TaxID=201153 RepID=A0A8J6AYW4_9EUKA|nr:AAA-like domain [Carpediemonas membranifera]|eukprot:KAG9397423.1 AAA-like domain [Carpediemonas membranifera]